MSTGGLLALKWNNHCSSFLHILSSLHKKHNYDDATVACDGKLYPVHKLVLSTCSEYFEEMFENTHGKHPVIVLNKDINRHIFEALLQYMYIGEVNVVQEKLTELISAAECLRIKGLAVPDEPPPETSFRSNKSGGSGKRKQDHIVQSSSNNEEGYNPPSKIHKSHSGGGNSNRSTFHSSNENSRNEHATPISNNSNNKPPSSRNNNFNVENSSRGNSTFQSRRTTKHTMEERQANQLKEDDYIEEIPSNPVKEELVDPEHTGNEKNAEHKISNAGSGGDEDGVCDESGVGLLSGGGGDAEEDSKYGILAETVGGGGGNEEGNTWNEAINNKEGESDDVYGDYTGEGSTPAAIDDGEDTSQQPDDITHGASPTPDDDCTMVLNKREFGHQHFQEFIDAQPITFAAAPQLPESLSYATTLAHNATLLPSSHQHGGLLSNEMEDSIQSATNLGLPTTGPGIGNEYRYQKLTSGKFVCDICAHESIYLSQIQVHMRMHSGAKPFKCHICSFSTAQIGNLNAHVRLHTGSRLFSCNFCHYKAKCKKSTMLHMTRMHPNQFGHQSPQ